VRAQPVNGAMQTGYSAGTCLHLGASGKRCYRPATSGGFCEKHDPERQSRSPLSLVRLGAALLLLWAVLWPVIADVVRELQRWLHK
jgi:uncharacterized protein DUF5763